MTTTYRSNVGRLVVDRYDFQNHIDGYSLNHPASAIQLEDPIEIYVSEISLVTVTTVQEAITALSEVIVPYSIPDASGVNRGLIKLLGDLGGSALAPTVTRIQGKLINTELPADGDVLTWDSTASTWGPAEPTTFSAGIDLIGTNSVQEVIQITGLGGTVGVLAHTVHFNTDNNIQFTHEDHVTDHGHDMLLIAQTSTFLNKDGGDVVISGGSPGIGGKLGGVTLCMDSGAIAMIDAREVAAGRRVIGLFNGSEISSTQMPSDTGDMVMFIKNAATEPTSGSPVGGAILYSSIGQLRIKESNGSDFNIGSSPNPTVWGSSGQFTYQFRIKVQSTSTFVITALTYPISDNSTVRVNAVFVGKKVGSADASHYDVVMGYYRSGGAPVDVGAVVVNDTRIVGASTPWLPPTITLSGNNVLVKTGSSAFITINWYVHVTIYICGD